MYQIAHWYHRSWGNPGRVGMTDVPNSTERTFMLGLGQRRGGWTAGKPRIYGGGEGSLRMMRTIEPDRIQKA